MEKSFICNANIREPIVPVEVSVVIPLYNKLAYIQRAIDSVLAQTFRNFELIIVDDGSTDGSGELALGYLDSRLQVFSQSNQGECAARNRGIAESHGKWIAFLDADDEWLPGFLEPVIEFARAHSFVSCVFTNILNFRTGKPRLVSQFFEPCVLENYFAFSIQNGGRGITSSSVMVNKKIVEEIGGFPVGIHRSGDTDTWLRLTMLNQVGFVPAVLSIYHNEVPGSSVLFPRPFFPQAVKTLRRLRVNDDIPSSAISDTWRLENLYLIIYVRDLILYGDCVQARRVLFTECVWRYCPIVSFLKALVRSFFPFERKIFKKMNFFNSNLKSEKDDA